MSGPWERYGQQAATPAGPWAKYQPAEKQGTAPSMQRDSAEQVVAQIEAQEGRALTPDQREQVIKAAQENGFDLPVPQPRKDPGTTPGLNEGPEHGMRPTDLRVAGFGKSMRDTFLGGMQLLAAGGATGEAVRALAHAAGIQTPENPIENYFRDAAFANETADNELLGTTGGRVGNVAGNIATMLVPGTGVARTGTAVNTVGRAALEGGALAGLQPVKEGDSRLANIAIGSAIGAGGQKVGQGLGALARGGANRFSPEVLALVKKAKDAGIQVGLPQLMQNGVLRTMLDQMQKLPLSGGRAIEEANRRAFNRAVSNAFGEDADAITPEVYSAAKSRLGSEFERLSSRADLPAGPRLLAQLGRIRSQVGKIADDDTVKAVNNEIDDLIRRAGPGGVIPGAAYQSFDSALGKIIKLGGEKGHFLGQVRDVVRNAMDDAAPAADKAARQLARKQYAALKTVRDLVAKDTGEGISPQALMARVTSTQAGKERAAQGAAGELGQLARIGQRFLRASPDSGTSSRMLVNGAAGGAIVGTAPFSPPTALALLGTLLGNRVALKAANSAPVMRYATRGLPAPVQKAVSGKAVPRLATAASLTPALTLLREILGNQLGAGDDNPRND